MVSRRRLMFWITVGFSLALPAVVVLVAASHSDRLRAWTSSVLESTADVQHRKAVLAARAGHFDESIALFDQALAGGAGEVAWIDYLKTLSWARRYEDVLRAWERMPRSMRSRSEVLTTVAQARFERGEGEAVADLITGVMAESDPEAARRFGDALAAADVRKALTSVREALREHPDQARWVEPSAMEVLHRRAVARARAGEPQAALAVLDELAAASPTPTVIGDRLVVLCWAGRAREAVELLLSVSAVDAVPEYALAELARAWRDDEKMASLPDDTLTRLLERARAHPDLCSELIAGCRSDGQLAHARAALPKLLSGAADSDALATRLHRDLDRRLALRRAAVQRLEREAIEAQHRRAVEFARSGQLEAATRLIEQVCRGTDDPAVHIDRAVILSWAQHHAEAVAAFEGLPPESPRPSYLLVAIADSYRSLGARESALALYREVLANEPEHRPALEALTELLIESERSSNPRKVVKALDLKGLPAAELRARLAHREAVLLGRAGEYERALAMLEVAAKALEGDEDIAWDRVALLSWAGLHWEAVEAYEALPARWKSPAWIRREAAEAYRATYRPGAALALYADLLAEDPADASSLHRLQALLDENRARMIAPGVSRLAGSESAALAWVTLRDWADDRHGDALELAQRGSSKAAMGALREALASPSSSHGVLADDVVLLYLSRRYPEAVALSRALSRAEHATVEALVVAASSASGKPADALAAARRWLSRNPADPTAASAVVHRLLALGRANDAWSVIASLPTKARPRLSADVLLYSGDATRATALYREQLRAAPNDREAALGLAAALALQGDPDAPLRTAAALDQLSLEEYLLHHTLSASSALALAKVLDRIRRPAEAGAVLAALLASNPNDVDALFELGLSYELRREMLEAAGTYERVLRLGSHDRRAGEARTRALLQLGAVSAIDGRDDRMLLQTRAVQSWDWRQTALAPEEHAQATLDALHSVEPVDLKLDDAALRASAEAHAELGRDERALELYRALAARLEEEGADGSPELFSARMEQIRCLQRLMRFDEAGALLDRLDAETPDRLEGGRHVEPNWDKAELALERGWWLVAQDRLVEAEAHFADLLRRSPRSAEAGSALAQTHLMRGWPRLAQRELEEAAALHPDDLDVRLELARARDANQDHAGADRIVSEVSASFPDDPGVRELLRSRELARRPELSTEVAADTGAAGTDGLQASLGFGLPVHARAKLGATVEWKREGSRDEIADRRRVGVGAELAAHRDLTVEAWASGDPIARTGRLAATVAWAPSDHFALELHGDSDSWALPYGALRAGVLGRELEASGTYRHSEVFEVETRLRALGLDDGNRVLGAEVEAELQFLTTGRWRASLLAESGAEASNASDVPYFSPARSGSASLMPAVEHVWLRTRGYELVDRISFAAGASYESGYGLDELGELAYQMRHRFAELGELVLETAVSRRFYEGLPELGWRLAVGSQFRF